MSQENVEIVRRVSDRWSTGDLGGSDAFDPAIDYVRIGPSGTGLSGEFHGSEAAAKALRECLQSWSDVRIKAERIVDLDDGRVVVFAHQTGRGTGSGTPLDLRTADIWTVQGGKLNRCESYWNREEALEAAGLSE
jgi:ketosteroid isomerase-like protein